LFILKQQTRIRGNEYRRDYRIVTLFNPKKKPGAHSKAGWLGIRAGLDNVEK
jgi:hypothetical protein